MVATDERQRTDFEAGAEDGADSCDLACCDPPVRRFMLSNAG
jgi:hypothetical protein